MRDEQTMLADLHAAMTALEPLTQMLKVGYNTNLIHLEIDGIPVCRPIEPAMREKLGTLFTHLFNATALLARLKAAYPEVKK